jgi:hypothetical protein
MAYASGVRLLHRPESVSDFVTDGPCSRAVGFLRTRSPVAPCDDVGDAALLAILTRDGVALGNDGAPPREIGMAVSA